MGELYNPFPKLPKNIRQMGESDPIIRFYMEDYVNTYLKRLYPIGNQTMRVGLLLGNVEYYDGVPYVFIDGAMEMEEVETDGERVLFSESTWKKAYQCIENMFPKRTIQGWFLCGSSGSQLSPLNYWKQHSQYFAGKNQLMYLNHGLEGEESVYITSEDGFYRLKGHCIYYERNQMMQDYMITRKDVRRVESSSQETVIRDFRSRLAIKREQATVQNRTLNAMGILCGVLAVAVLAGGVALVNNYTKMQKMESVLASVLPENTEYWGELQGGEEDKFIIEEVAGKVYPTEEFSAEREEQIDAETMNAEREEQNMQEIEFEAESAVVAETMASVPELVGMDKGIGEGDSLEFQPSKIDYATAAANGYRIYHVGEGETLYGICWKQYGGLEYLEEICRLNQLKNVDRILAGQKLILP
ncbi:MAG: LysM peptidoglycan-binding domain-containing protein [Lachnospiraceae bacterium]|nr:LysM peptidoglycan-binding domain-containing protein [Lachnospiraceae bacterium]